FPRQGCCLCFSPLVPRPVLLPVLLRPFRPLPPPPPPLPWSRCSSNNTSAHLRASPSRLCFPGSPRVSSFLRRHHLVSWVALFALRASSLASSSTCASSSSVAMAFCNKNSRILAMQSNSFSHSRRSLLL